MKKLPHLILAILLSGVFASAYAEENTAKTDATVQEKPVVEEAKPVVAAEPVAGTTTAAVTEGEKKPEAGKKKSGMPEPDCN